MHVECPAIFSHHILSQICSNKPCVEMVDDCINVSFNQVYIHFPNLESYEFLKRQAFEVDICYSSLLNTSCTHAEDHLLYL